MTFLLTLVLGLVGGIASGFLGIGGGIILVPALVFLLGFSQPLAQGTTLAAMVPPIGILAALQYYKAGNVNMMAAIGIALGFLFGGWIGGITVNAVAGPVLKKAFALLLAFVAVKMWFGK